MSQGFVAQYAAEASLATEGVERLDHGLVVSLKDAIGVGHEGRGVRVSFRRDRPDAVAITVYPIVKFGYVMPDVAWSIQEHVKEEVELYTGLNVEAVNVHVMGVSDIVPDVGALEE
ncbi:MAG TPA: Asp23/Gls24 family envelope stress response protein [Clostridiaceae bacterium]|nr:Asp23/Gls24 family envelope stress response protein [Clostridiaceae bacterium]